MAITKLMHVKESKSGNPHGGMHNCIRYVLDPKKTEDGYWVGGNAGKETEPVYRNFLEVKKEFQKLDGRQCYHFVISFQPGETDAVTVYNVAQEFCERYLGSQYQYVFAVHTDHPHLHAHIVFNSVSFADGHKYHYRDGDWKKEIQPVTDAITQKYHLQPLTYEEKRKGVPYGLWMAQKGKAGSLKEDLDQAIRQAASYRQFLRIMERKYQVRRGFSKKWQSEYLAFKNEQMPRGFRSYSLGEAYTAEAIQKRIELKGFCPEKRRSNVPVPPVRRWQTRIGGSWKRKDYLTPYQKRYLYYYWQIKKSERKFSGGQETKTAAREAEEMLRCLKYLIQNGIHGEEGRKERRKELKQQGDYYRLQKSLAMPTAEEKEVEKILERYRELTDSVERQEDEKTGAYENQLDELEEKYPIEDWIRAADRKKEQQARAKEELKRIRGEQRILSELQKMEKKKGLVL